MHAHDKSIANNGGTRGRFAGDWKKVAQQLEPDSIEVGAVNCQTEEAICADRFAIRSYPTIRMVSRLRGAQQEYPLPWPINHSLHHHTSKIVEMQTPIHTLAFFDLLRSCCTYSCAWAQ